VGPEAVARDRAVQVAARATEKRRALAAHEVALVTVHAAVAAVAAAQPPRPPRPPRPPPPPPPPPPSPLLLILPTRSGTAIVLWPPLLDGLEQLGRHQAAGAHAAAAAGGFRTAHCAAACTWRRGFRHACSIHRARPHSSWEARDNCHSAASIAPEPLRVAVALPWGMTTAVTIAAVAAVAMAAKAAKAAAAAARVAAVAVSLAAVAAASPWHSVGSRALLHSCRTTDDCKCLTNSGWPRPHTRFRTYPKRHVSEVTAASTARSAPSRRRDTETKTRVATPRRSVNVYVCELKQDHTIHCVCM
jgi:hypothetical protein